MDSKRTTEDEILIEFYEIILDVVNNPKYPGRKARICKNYCISPNSLKAEKMVRGNNSTFFRLMAGLSLEAPQENEFFEMLDKMKYFTIEVAERLDGTFEAIIKAHEGSIIGRKKAKSIKKDKKK